MLPNVAFASFTSRFRPPALDEGFQDLVQIDFQVCVGNSKSLFLSILCGEGYAMCLHGFEPLQFAGDEEQRAIWSKHWI